jgi:hypothetical protein
MEFKRLRVMMRREINVLSSTAVCSMTYGDKATTPLIANSQKQA